MKQWQLAEVLKVTPQQISNYERARHRISGGALQTALTFIAKRLAAKKAGAVREGGSPPRQVRTASASSLGGAGDFSEPDAAPYGVPTAELRETIALEQLAVIEAAVQLIRRTLM